MAEFKVYFQASKIIKVRAKDADEAIALAKKEADSEPADWDFVDIDDLDELKKDGDKL